MVVSGKYIKQFDQVMAAVRSLVAVRDARVEPNAVFIMGQVDTKTLNGLFPQVNKIPLVNTSMHNGQH